MSDPEGNRIGTVVEWVDLTEQLRREEEDRQRAAEEARVAAENARIKAALDKVTTNVMMADADLNIIYLNDTVVDMMTNAQSDIQKELPNFNVNSLIGTNIDGFHKNPAHQRNMLANLNGTFTSQLELGGRTFRIIANPVMDESGARLGTVVEWADRTQEVAVEREVSGMVEAVIGGELRRRISLDDKEGFFRTLSEGINGLVDNVSEMVSQVKVASNEVSRGADEISQGNANLSQRTEEQASSLEQTASSMEEMTSTVKQNADNSGQANQLAVAARDQAEKGGQVVAKAVGAMTEINESSKKIADIISVIDEIAFQTNLLALNAAVEAARAGEQGRGFAVVASEVRNLAGRSATAAKEIKDLIQDSVKKVEEGSDLVTESGTTLEQIVTAVKKVSDIIAEIAAASQEQSSGIEQVNKAVMQLDELTQQNAALVEEASAASQSMADQARGLDTMMARYHVNDDDVARAQAGMQRAASSAGQQPPQAERRSADRPWSEPAPADSKPAPAEAPAAMAATGTDDADWQEF
jgi:methyl-accepting chemotaxis protein